MASPSKNSSLRVAPTPLTLQYIALAFFGIIGCVIFYTVWTLLHATSLWWIWLLIGMGAIVSFLMALRRIWRDAAYELNAKGISTLDVSNRPTHVIEWSDFVEVRSSKQNGIFLYTQGRERFVEITTHHQNYSKVAPVLAEHLAPLWRECNRQRYDKTGGAYLLFLLAIVYVIVSIIILIQAFFAGLLFMAAGLFFLYHQSTRVRRIEFTSDGLALTKVYGSDLISAAAIRAIETQDLGSGYAYRVLLRLRDNRTIPLDGFGLDPISLHCIVAAWQRDQLAGSHL